MEIALRYELNKITELTNKIYPTNAPTDTKPPYLVYISSTQNLKDLNGVKSNAQSDVLLNIFASSYSEMKDITKKVKKSIIGFQSRTIGGIPSFIFVEEITIDKLSEAYEEELQLYRGIIPFTISYKEE